MQLRQEIPGGGDDSGLNDKKQGKCGGDSPEEPGLRLIAAPSAQSHLMLNGGDDEIGFEATDSRGGGGSNQRFAMGEGQNGADEVIGDQIREIPGRGAALAENGRAGPIRPPHRDFYRLNLH